MTQTESFTNSESLAPWKRGEVPAAHWPDFAADREPAGNEAPPMLHSALRHGLLASVREHDRDRGLHAVHGELDSERCAPDREHDRDRGLHAVHGELDSERYAPNREIDLDRVLLESDRDPPALHSKLDKERNAPDRELELHRVLLGSDRDPPALHSELAADRRLALEAFKSLDALDDTSLDDDLDEELLDEDLVEEASADGYVPPLIDRTTGTFTRVASKVLIPFAAVVILVIAMGGTWSTADATPAAAVVTAPAAVRSTDDADHPRAKSSHKDLSGKLNLNTASEDQLMMLPTVGPSKADRIVAWRKKNGGFKRTADLRHVKGFGYKTFKKLEPFLDVKGDTTLVAK